ncbi:MAG: hypothetical protein LBS21_09960 [Clostridiales bacterium]|jgi:uncharacterized protein YwgA|nr:hypothetical protein [Clostridiales bacterium]
MSEKVAYVIRELSGYLNENSGAPLGKKVLQKICYLIERSGMDMDLDYRIHFYGPYSPTLNSTLFRLESDGFINIDSSGTVHHITFTGKEISLKPSLKENKLINYIIGKFGAKSAMELEVLTTTDFVAETILKNPADNEIVDKVLEIKGRKFTEEQIKESIVILKAEKLLAS